MIAKSLKKAAIGVAMAVTAGLSGAAQAGVTDTVETPTLYFIPTDALKTTAPYYRGQNEDWSYAHGAIGGTISSASLNISAFDVDYVAGDPRSELDNIYAYDNGVRTLLGNLNGASDIYSFTNFTLGANFYDDIASGLIIDVDIDANNTGLWLLSIAKSSLSVNGGRLPPPAPGGSVPEPATWAMMIAGFGFAGVALRRRGKQVVRFA